MIIVNKSRTIMLNMDSVTEIRLPADAEEICVRYVSGDKYVFERYGTPELARIAMKMLSERITTESSTVYMPTEDDIKSKMTYEMKSLRTNSPKKYKGHGGS